MRERGRGEKSKRQALFFLRAEWLLGTLLITFSKHNHENLIGWLFFSSLPAWLGYSVRIPFLEQSPEMHLALKDSDWSAPSAAMFLVTREICVQKRKGGEGAVVPSCNYQNSNDFKRRSRSKHTSPCASMNRPVFNPQAHILRRTAAFSGKRAEGIGGLSSSRLGGGWFAFLNT